MELKNKTIMTQEIMQNMKTIKLYIYTVLFFNSKILFRLQTHLKILFCIEPATDSPVTAAYSCIKKYDLNYV